MMQVGLNIDFDWAYSMKRKLNKKNDEALLKSIDEARQEINTARSNFEYATDEYLIDAYVYKIKAAEMHYSHLLRQAKLEA